MSDRLSEIDEFSSRIEMLSLGDVVDLLIELRLDDKLNPDVDAEEKSVRVLKIKALKQELSSRQVGNEDTTPTRGGVSSLGSLFD